jgi:hypothetical protein
VRVIPSSKTAMARVERKAAPSNCLSLRFDIDVLVEPALLPVVEVLLGVLAEILLLLLLLLPPLLPAADDESAAMLMVMVGFCVAECDGRIELAR